MIQRQDVPLSGALTNFRVLLGAAAWVRFFQVDAPCDVKFDSLSALPMPVASPFTVSACSAPFNTLYITAAAAAGILSIVWSSDGEESVDDFLGSAAAALITTQSFLLTESMLAHMVINANNTNPQDILGVGDGATYGVSAGGAAGQAVETTAFNYYGGLLASVLASAVALNGGNMLIANPRIPNTAVLSNLFSTTAPGFTRSNAALAAGGFYFLRTDSLLETPVVGVGGSIYAAIGIGFDITAATAANGVAGLRGIGAVWSNELGNNNWHLIAADGGAAIARNVDTGVNAIAHQLIELQFGVLGTLPIVRLLVDGAPAGAPLTGWGTTFLTITGFAAATLALRMSAGKLQAGQNGNNVRWHFGGYSGIQFGRLS